MVHWKGFFPLQSVIQEIRFLLHIRLNYMVLKISKLFSSSRSTIIKAKLLFFCASGRIAQIICDLTMTPANTLYLVFIYTLCCIIFVN